jgi:hypothetical protein
MTEGVPTTPISINCAQVEAFRRGALANGYMLLRVATADKRPVSAGWQSGDRDDLLLNVDKECANTGLILAGLRAVDIDVDDGVVVNEILESIKRILPAGALVRGRSGSPRLALVYRSSNPQAKKRSLELPSGKIEILGHGQQLVVDGVHPSGAPLSWLGDRSPANVPYRDLSVVDEAQVTAFLLDVGAKFPARQTQAQDALPPRAELAGAPVINDLAAGIEAVRWFDHLTAADKKHVVATCLAALDNTKSDPRPLWLQTVFAVADAGRQGCPEARALVLEWSRKGARWTGEADFDVAWNSARPGGGVTLGTLLRSARDAGVDLSRWRDMALGAAAPIPFFEPTPSHVAGVAPQKVARLNLSEVPRHRPWVLGTRLLRGEITILAAPGGRAKTALATMWAASLSSGRCLVGEHVFGGSKTVLFISTEDSSEELQRRFIAAATAHSLVQEDLDRIHLRGVDHGSLSLTHGTDRMPMVNVAAITLLMQLVRQVDADVVILDPLGPLVPIGLNDNGLMGDLVHKLKKAAIDGDFALLILHHFKKGSDGGAESVSGASALVNHARAAFTLEVMANEIAQAKGVLPSDQWRYLRVVNLKSNLAPPAQDDDWQYIASVTLRNAEPPVYQTGDAVQVITAPPAASTNYLDPAAQARIEARYLKDVGDAHADGDALYLSARGRAKGSATALTLLRDLIVAETNRSIQDATRIAGMMFASLSKRGLIQEIEVGARKGKTRAGIVPGPATLARNAARAPSDDG